MTAEAQLHTPQQPDSDYAYHANCREFNTIIKTLTKESDLETYLRGVRRLTQLNNELEALL